ncbi:MAG: inositol monophosphatase [Polyangiaceae bacterium]|jgi:myo-inositol-1(or 4)-monophosphatase|nr:inositol monophosphatase [Polyangiaceae bacterium]
MFLREQAVACAAAREAGAVLLRHFRRVPRGAVHEKGKHDLVSVADRESEGVLRKMLLDAFPGDAFLGEETGAHGTAGRRWIVDPLDGTLNFLQGFAHWCVSVALWDEQGPAAACVYDPVKGDEFSAARGSGASWNGTPAHASEHQHLEGSFLAVGFAYQLGARARRMFDGMEAVFPRAKGIRRAGSAALDLAYTAAGIHDGFFELGLQPWDQAAGVLLVLEAGGVVSDWNQGVDCLGTGDIIAAGSASLHRELEEALKVRSPGV